MILDKVISELDRKISEKSTPMSKYIKAKITELQEIIKKEKSDENKKKIHDCLLTIEQIAQDKHNKRQILVSKKLVNQTNYVMMLSIDYEATLKIDKQLIYEITDAMTGVYYENYKNCLIAFQNPQFSELLDILKTNQKDELLVKTLGGLVDVINIKEIPYVDAFVNSYVRNLTLDNKINMPTLRNTETTKTEDNDRKREIIREIESIIASSSESNEIIHKSLLSKKSSLLEIEKMPPEKFKKILEFNQYLKTGTSLLSQFHAAAYTLNLLQVQKYIDITKKDMEQMYELVKKINQYSYHDYEEVLSQENEINKNNKTF